MSLEVKLEVQVAKTVDEALYLKEQGYIPVECVYGSQSVVDCYEMDHHNDYWDLEPVSLRAYRDHYGVARTDPRFVVGPKADLDATFAIAALAGLVPHPKHRWAKRYPINACNHLQLAQMIARRDDEPLFNLPVGRNHNANVIAYWESKRRKSSHEANYYQCVSAWWDLLAKLTPQQIVAQISDYKQHQDERIKAAQECKVEAIGNGVGFVSAAIWGFDQWLIDYDIIVSHQCARNRILLSAKSKQRAIELFGKRGLLELRNHISGQWGGRANMLLPASGLSYHVDDAKILSEQISAMLN